MAGRPKKVNPCTPDSVFNVTRILSRLRQAYAYAMDGNYSATVATLSGILSQFKRLGDIIPPDVVYKVKIEEQGKKSQTGSEQYEERTIETVKKRISEIRVNMMRFCGRAQIEAGMCKVAPNDIYDVEETLRNLLKLTLQDKCVLEKKKKQQPGQGQSQGQSNVPY